MMLLALLLLGQPARVRSIDSVPGALYKLLRQLTPVEKGCKASSGTKIASSAPALRADPVFCETLLPKMRQCVVYSFGVGRTGWDLDKALASDGRCRVKSFDATCCGGFHSIPYLAASASHDFVPLVLAPSDGLVVSSPATGNITAAGLTLKSLMAGFGDSQRSMVTQRGGGLSSGLSHCRGSSSQPTPTSPIPPPFLTAGKLDVLRLSVSSRFEWKAPARGRARISTLTSQPHPRPRPDPYYLTSQALRGLVDTPGVLKTVPQLLLSIHFSEPSRYDDYVEMLQALRAHGFLPFYVKRQPSAEYLQIQVGESQLWSSYEVGLGNARLS